MHIAIVGAGIMGRVLAWQLLQKDSQKSGQILSEENCQISLFDRDPIASGSAAAYTAAGMLAPYAEVESAELDVYRMGMTALQLWPDIVETLVGDVGFRQAGSLVVAHPGDRAELQHFNQQLSHKLPHSTAQYQLLQGEALQQREPELAERFDQASYLPEEAWIDSHKVMAALATYLLEQGVSWHEETEVEALGSGYITVAGEQQFFDWVIDCRGLGAKADLPALRGVRGEIIELQAPEVKLKHLIRLMHPRYRIYIVPREDDIYLVGATQLECDDMAPITVRSSLELLSAAYSLHSGFSEARILNTRVNCRPAFADNLPAIHCEPGLMRINGLFRHGYLLAPVLAQEACQWLSSGNEHHSLFTDLFQCA